MGTGTQATLSFSEQEGGKTPPPVWSREVLRTHWGSWGVYQARLVITKDTQAHLGLAIGERGDQLTASCPGWKVEASLGSERKAGSWRRVQFLGGQRRPRKEGAKERRAWGGEARKVGKGVREAGAAGLRCPRHWRPFKSH